MALGVGCIAVMASSDSQIPFEAILPFTVLTLFVWGAGRVAHSRGRIAAELRVRTEQLRVLRDERARLEVATDRGRLSGELDELLQRRLGELARLADAGAGTTDPAVATATLVSIEEESRQTLQQMRALVGVLRSSGEDGGPPLRNRRSPRWTR